MLRSTPSFFFFFADTATSLHHLPLIMAVASAARPWTRAVVRSYIGLSVRRTERQAGRWHLFTKNTSATESFLFLFLWFFNVFFPSIRTLFPQSLKKLFGVYETNRLRNMHWFKLGRYDDMKTCNMWKYCCMLQYRLQLTVTAYVQELFAVGRVSSDSKIASKRLCMFVNFLMNIPWLWRSTFATV